MLFSDRLSPYVGSLNTELESAIEEIKSFFKVDDLEILSFDEYNIAVAVEYKISLPSRGSVSNLIRAVEPVLIKLPLIQYPIIGPIILPNRLDFPKEMLSHLYISKKGAPPGICLIRGDFNEWFATMRMTDFLLVGEVWFYKAAAGILSDDNNEFDPTLIVNESFTHIYKYENLNEIVIENRRFIQDFPMSVNLGYFVGTSSSLSEKGAIISLRDIPFLKFKELNDLVPLISQETVKEDINPLYNFLLWDPNQTTEANHSTSLPENYGELKLYFSMRGISLDNILEFIRNKLLIERRVFFITFGIKRPRKLIALNGDIEFFTFLIRIPGSGLKDLNDETEVFICKHIEPFSKKIAETMSNEKRELKSLFIGAGSLGSKMIIHDARSGKSNIGVVDDDIMQQHNLARHALYANSMNQNKATAIIEEIKQFFRLDDNQNFYAYDKNVFFVSKSEISNYNQIIDSTASKNVLNYFVNNQLPEGLSYTRCEIADDGDLGLLYTEGDNRNPRIDDLFNLTVYKAVEDEDLQLWRTNDAKKEIKTVDIGQGCSSTTTIMPDDTISYHASVFSRVINSNIQEKTSQGNGVIYLSVKREKDVLPVIYNKIFYVEPFDVFPCKANSGWQVRMLGGLSEKFLKLCNEYNPNETGGVLIGVANYKTRVMHVFDFITQTNDSIGTPTRFIRGIENLPEEVNEIKFKTGNVMGYIGEWHTHPMNLSSLSGQDMESIEKLKVVNAKTPIPTLAIIVTQTEILPFIYE